MTRNRRSSVRPLVVVLAAGVALVACGNRLLSPAAVVDGRLISQQSLQDEVDIAAAANAVTADLTRQVLSGLIQLEVAQEYADARGIAVTQADVDRELQTTIQQVGGQDAFDQLLRQRGLTLDVVRHLLRNQALYEKVRDDVVARLSPPPGDTTQARDAAFQRWLADRVTRADVSVNPRFGRFDPATGNVVAITSTADLG